MIELDLLDSCGITWALGWGKVNLVFLKRIFETRLKCWRIYQARRENA